MEFLHYLDTSAVVPLLVHEAASDRLDAWIRTSAGRSLAISPWVDAEVASALSMKVRGGGLTIEQRAAADLGWHRWRMSMRCLPVEPIAFEKARDFAGRHDITLRASDALHIAIATGASCVLVTLDEQMARAAPKCGLPVVTI